MFQFCTCHVVSKLHALIKSFKFFQTNFVRRVNSSGLGTTFFLTKVSPRRTASGSGWNFSISKSSNIQFERGCDDQARHEGSTQHVYQDQLTKSMISKLGFCLPFPTTRTWKQRQGCQHLPRGTSCRSSSPVSFNLAA